MSHLVLLGIYLYLPNSPLKKENLTIFRYFVIFFLAPTPQLKLREKNI